MGGWAVAFHRRGVAPLVDQVAGGIEHQHWDVPAVENVHIVLGVHPDGGGLAHEDAVRDLEVLVERHERHAIAHPRGACGVERRRWRAGIAPARRGPQAIALHVRKQRLQAPSAGAVTPAGVMHRPPPPALQERGPAAVVGRRAGLLPGEGGMAQAVDVDHI